MKSSRFAAFAAQKMTAAEMLAVSGGADCSSSSNNSQGQFVDGASSYADTGLSAPMGLAATSAIPSGTIEFSPQNVDGSPIDTLQISYGK